MVKRGKMSKKGMNNMVMMIFLAGAFFILMGSCGGSTATSSSYTKGEKVGSSWVWRQEYQGHNPKPQPKPWWDWS